MPSSPDAYRPPSLSLLYTSRQLRAETLSLIAREKVDVSLDFAILDMLWLWPTYRIILPRTSKTLKKLVVHISLATSDESSHNRRMHATYEAFWSFLNRFLMVGPIGDMAYDEPDLDMHLRELRINFDSEKHRTGNYVFSQEEIPTRAVEGLAHLTDNHKWLYGADAEIAKSWIDQFVANVLDSHVHRTPWLAAVLGKIERTVFCVDGEVRCERVSEKI
jgi:hypothetical protein